MSKSLLYWAGFIGGQAAFIALCVWAYGHAFPHYWFYGLGVAYAWGWFSALVLIWITKRNESSL